MGVCISCRNDKGCKIQRKFERLAGKTLEVRFGIDIFYCKNHVREAVVESWTKSIPAYKSSGVVTVKQSAFTRQELSKEEKNTSDSKSV